jgi:hypothetical protein
MRLPEEGESEPRLAADIRAPAADQPTPLSLIGTLARGVPDRLL